MNTTTSLQIITIEENIERLFQENEEYATKIAVGSDEHLDILILAKELLNESTNRLNALNDKLYSGLNNLSNSALKKNILPKLVLLGKSCMELINIAKDGALYNGVETCLETYVESYELLNEVIYDIKNFRLAKGSELDNILKQS